MEKQYIFFKTSNAFWFCMFCGLFMFFALVALAAYVKPPFWLVGVFTFAYSSIATFAAFKIDSKK